MATGTASISGTGLTSGIDYNTLITQLMNIDKQPLTLLQNKQQAYQVEIASVADITAKLGTFKSSVAALNSQSAFNTKTASVTHASSGDPLMTVSASASAVAGSHTIFVNQLAAANKIGAQGWQDQNTTPISAGADSFKFKVGTGGAVTSVAVDSSTTLQGLRDAINSSGGGVTASIINSGVGTNPYRISLTSNTPGADNKVYITQNNTNLDFSSKRIGTAYADTNNAYTGTVSSNEGTNYTGSANQTFLLQIVAGGTPGSGSAQYKYSIDGGITWLGSGGAAFTGSNGVAITADGTLQNIDGLADGATTTEGAKIKFTGGTLTADDRFSVDALNPQMQAGQDAVINVDNSTITRNSNSITDVIQGVTMNLVKADTSSPVTLTVSSDSSGAQTSIQDFVTSYNAVMDDLNTQLSYDPSTQQGSPPPLLGDTTITEIRRKIGNIVSGTIPGLSTKGYTSLSQIGITSDYKTGQLSLDTAKLSAALSSDPDGVAKLFIGTATATNTAVSFVSKTAKTQPGTYSVSVSAAPEKATLLGGQSIDSSGIAADETLSFTFSADKTDPTPTYKTFSVTLNQGSAINTIVNTLNSTFATNGAGLTASNEGGKIRISSTEYGSDQYVRVGSNLGNVAGQVGFNVDGTSADTGVDIAGDINGHRASGTGDILTAASGFGEDGLKLSIDSSKTGAMGTVAISSGVADRLPTSLASYVDPTNGVLKTKQDSIQSTIDDLTTQENTMQTRLDAKEQSLRDQFARLETLLTKINATSQYLTSQIDALYSSSK